MNKNYQHVIEGISAEIAIDNIDTDQIIPTEYLKSIKKYGFGDFLFDGWRYKDEGNIQKDTSQREQNEDFILNIDPYKKSKILVVGKNFGCGSSREHAVWAIQDYGIRCVIALSFADIFYNNCFKNGLLAIVLNKTSIDKLFKISHAGEKIHIDLINQVILNSDELEIAKFEIDDFRKTCILEGLDEIGLSLKYSKRIKAFEDNKRQETPWVFK